MKVKIENETLKSVVIPSSVTSIGVNVFACNQLTNVTIEGDATRFNDRWEEIGFPLDLMPKKK